MERIEKGQWRIGSVNRNILEDFLYRNGYRGTGTQRNVPVWDDEGEFKGCVNVQLFRKE